jgi:1,4-dihydroxy-6-naphthoate synthase
MEVTTMSCLVALYSGDPDDAFAWWSILVGRSRDAFLELDCRASSVAAAGDACLEGGPDVAAISAATYPWIARDYVVLDAGASVGRGYGPLLVGRRGSSLQGLRGCRVAVAGARTTGGALFRLLHPECTAVEKPWREIPGAIRSGEVAAGVCIHETLMAEHGDLLAPLECLGGAWTRETGLPLPVGLVVARRSLSPTVHNRLTRLLRESLEDARCHRAEALGFARRFSIGVPPQVMETYVDRFANDDTARLLPDCRIALSLLFDRLGSAGLCPDHQGTEVLHDVA